MISNVNQVCLLSCWPQSFFFPDTARIVSRGLSESPCCSLDTREPITGSLGAAGGQDGKVHIIVWNNSLNISVHSITSLMCQGKLNDLSLGWFCFPSNTGIGGLSGKPAGYHISFSRPWECILKDKDEITRFRSKEIVSITQERF